MVASVATTIAAIGWEPEIRGALVVIIAVVVLLGSIYLVLATNSGARLGFLLAFTGLAGWMLIMGVTWTMYGIGLKGDSPSWDVGEVVVGDVGQAQNTTVRALADPDAAVGDGGWDALAEGEGDRADALASVDDFFVRENGANANAFLGDSDAEFLPLDVFDRGGKDDLALKPACSPHKPNTYDGCWDRTWNKIEQLAQLKHPTHYIVAQVQRAVTPEVAPGEPPAKPELDDDAPVVSVVLVRDIGNLRFPAMVVTIASLILFLIGVSQLHRRDLAAMEAVEAAGKA